MNVTEVAPQYYNIIGPQQLVKDISNITTEVTVCNGTIVYNNFTSPVEEFWKYVIFQNAKLMLR
jgi:hypothetical protein